MDPEAVLFVSTLGWQAFGLVFWLWWRERNRRYREEHGLQTEDDKRDDDFWW